MRKSFVPGSHYFNSQNLENNMRQVFGSVFLLLHGISYTTDLGLGTCIILCDSRNRQDTYRRVSESLLLP